MKKLVEGEREVKNLAGKIILRPRVKGTVIRKQQTFRVKQKSL